MDAKVRAGAHQAVGLGGQEVVFGDENNNPTWQNNLMFANGIDYSGITSQTGANGNISGDPLFINPSAPTYDFRVRQGSLSIDSGTPTGAPGTDFYGTVRPIDGDKRHPRLFEPQKMGRL